MDIKKWNSSVIYLIVAIGIVLRVYLYFLDRSLWIDEVYLSTGIVNKNFSALLSTQLDYYQKAPLGFLLFQKLFISLFSASEMSLRLFPLFSGIAALVLFVPVARYFLKENTVWLAVALFSFAYPLIYHSAEAKQYATELMITVLLLFLYARFRKDELNKKKFFTLAISGAVFIWFSYPVIFLLAGLSIAALIKAARVNNKKLLVSFFFPSALWLLSFGINYFFSTYKHTGVHWTIYWFNYYKHFMPFPPENIKQLEWFPVRFHRMLDYPLGLWWNFWGGTVPFSTLLKMSLFPALFFGVGWLSFFKERKFDFLFLSVSVLLMLVASGIKLYPLLERFYVFISPVFILFIVTGCSVLSQKYFKRQYRFILPAILLAGLITNAVKLLTDSDNFMLPKKSYQREAMQYVDKNFKQGDILYVYWNDRAGYNLYKRIYKFNFKAVQGKDFRFICKNYAEYFNLLQQDVPFKNQKRVWLLANYSFQSDIGELVDTPSWYFDNTSKTRPTDRVVAEFEKQGKIVDSLKKFDIQLYCFDISK
jgi:hypothetical protein